MRTILAFLCLYICFSINASTQNVCPDPPKVKDAEFSPSSVKSSYTAGDRLNYNCNDGYVTAQKISYICERTQNGQNKWTKLRGAQCLPRRCELPADIPNGQYAIVNGSNFVFGTVIKYTCIEGFQIMTRSDIRTCRANGWDKQLPVCEEITCNPDVIENSTIVDGLPDYGGLVRHGHKLTFSCANPNHIMKGQNEVTCQKNGQWSSPFPKCEKVTCVSNITSSNVNLPQCKEKERTECERPPTIENADTTEISVKNEYISGERVQYVCYNFYIMEGNPHMTCTSGEWKGNVKCLKPCTATIAEMDRRNIQQKYGEKKKMFATHKDHITFMCQNGKNPKGNVAFRQQCNDGVMIMPECE